MTRKRKMIVDGKEEKKKRVKKVAFLENKL